MTTTDKELHRELLDHISSEETRQAYTFLINELSNLPQVTRCAPGIKGVVKHVLIDINNLNIFSFIANRNSLKFYFRLVHRNPYTNKIGVLRNAGFEFDPIPNSKREERLSIHNLTDAKNLVRIVFGKGD